MSLALDGLLTDAERSHLEAHLETCPQCAATWTRMRNASALLWDSPLASPSAGFVRSVMGELEARQRRARRWRQSIAGAAALALLLIAGGLLAAGWLGTLWSEASTFRTVFASLIEAARTAIALMARGVQMPLGLLDQGQCALLLVSLAAGVLGCATLWAGILARIDRRLREHRAAAV